MATGDKKTTGEGRRENADRGAAGGLVSTSSDALLTNEENEEDEGANGGAS
jgi:hypothetical protein